MDQLDTFLAMGGYGDYVWPAYVLTVLSLTAMFLVTLLSLRAAERKLARIDPRPRRRRSEPRPRS